MQSRRSARWGEAHYCAFDACDLRAKALGYCSGHYMQRRRGESLRPLRPHASRAAVCSFDACGKPHEAKGLCKSHYSQKRRGVALSPLRDRSQGTTTKNGYRMLYRPGAPGAGANGQIAEHRLLMQALLGRPLRPEETVHHRNGVRDDNRMENLELWSSAHPAGQRVVDKVAWARELLALYGDVVA